MKVRVRFEVAGQQIDEIAEGKDAEDLIAQAKARVAKQLGWKGMVIAALSPLAFAQLAVRTYNDQHKTSFPLPETSEDFLEFAKQRGNLTILEP